MGARTVGPEVDETVRWLGSREALAMIEDDPYWPKWDGPWWRMLLLFELGLAGRIPRDTAVALARKIDAHYLHHFPTEPPPGVDPIAGIPCHCQLGNVYRVLHACGLDVDAELPWIRPWFLKYQLPDGGLNCDEAAYAKPTPRSSFLSTLPPLEAVLFCTERPFTPEERRFLDRGREYLVQRELCRSLSRGLAVIDESWLRPAFPRFYFYDILRGLRYVVKHALRFREALPTSALLETLGVLGAVEPVRRELASEPTRRRSGGEWGKGPSATFGLLDRVEGAALHREREEVFATVAWLKEAGLLD